MKKLRVLGTPELSRREFIRVATLAAGAAALLPACSPEPNTVGPELPTLGGAPDTPEGRAIAAFCDTVVPGKHRDPEGVLGAIDVGAPGLFFDPELPALAYVGLLVVVLDAYGRNTGGQPFAALDPAGRDVALAQAVAEVELLDFAVQLAKLAFYSSPDGAATLGYPGPNAGYVNDPDFSYRQPMSDEITEDGNFP